MSKVEVVAKFKINEENFDEVYGCLVELHKQTHANDEGCIKYDIHRDLENKFIYTFIETWDSMKNLEAHMQKEHFGAFIAKVEGKVEILSIDKLEKIEL